MNTYFEEHLRWMLLPFHKMHFWQVLTSLNIFLECTLPLTKQLCKHHLSRQHIFTTKTYNHAVTYNHVCADGNPQKISYA